MHIATSVILGMNSYPILQRIWRLPSVTMFLWIFNKSCTEMWQQAWHWSLRFHIKVWQIQWNQSLECTMLYVNPTIIWILCADGKRYMGVGFSWQQLLFHSWWWIINILQMLSKGQRQWHLWKYRIKAQWHDTECFHENGKNHAWCLTASSVIICLIGKVTWTEVIMLRARFFFCYIAWPGIATYFTSR